MNADTIREAYRIGALRPTGEWITCAAVDCDAAAAHDAVHLPDDGQRFYVPLCEHHIEATLSGRVQYEVISFGFIGNEVAS